MRIGIVLRASRLTLLSSLVLITSSAGCNAVIDFGGKFTDDEYEGRDSGARDGGGERDGSTEPERDGGGQSNEDGSTADGSVNDAEVSDAGGDGATNGGDAMSCPSQTEDCSNDEDDDCDMLEDCRDPDCIDEAVCCKPNQIPETSCSGGIDNDCDGDTDCADSDCISTCCTATGPEVGAIACSDEFDNDCDTVVDCAEGACAGQGKCCQPNPENSTASCMDGSDNDCDGLPDCFDPECAINAACCNATGPENTAAACGDNADNNCDGLVDCQDAGCATQTVCTSCVPSGDTESSCGDNIDNDCDRDRDCRDRDCSADLACCIASGSEDNSSTCVDSRDNDCDGLVDCDDPNCGGQLSCCVVSAENTALSCNDGKDNDCDLLVDCTDDSCKGAAVCCAPSGAENNSTACTDSIDNDCDGQLNCSDSDCAGIAACCTTSGGTTILAAGCCIPDGMAEAAAPNDGKDNDCDGLIDIPQRMSAFPIEGLPSAGNEVSLTFAPELNPSATLQCRTRRAADTSIPAWGPCPMSGVTVKPFTADPARPDNNGVWHTEVRWLFPGGGTSDIHVFRYYVHHTLRGVAHCTPAHNDQQWFDKAAPRLSTTNAGTFKVNEDTFLLNPFIRVSYKPPPSSDSTFELDGTLQSLNMWSLRRRFKLSADGRFLLITRNYRATRTGSCSAGTIQIHHSQRGVYDSNMNRYGCDAIVLNRAGAGVCLVNGSPDPQIPVSTESNSYANALGWPKANKFMWRIFMAPNRSGELNFTHKCATTPCGGIFLPDRALFPAVP